MSPTFLVECFWPGVTEAQVCAAAARAVAFPGRDEHAVRYLDSILIPDDEIVLFLASGPSAEAVHDHATRAGLRCDRVVESVRHASPSPAGGG
jgi:hypothetical protein